MKRYYIALAIITLFLVAVAFSMLLFVRSEFHLFMPLMAFYFAIVTGLQHFVVVKSMKKSPRQFVQFFLGSTVVALLLHMAVLFSVVFFRYHHQPHVAKVFILAFLVGFTTMLVFETVALVIYVNREKKNHKIKETNN